MNASMTSETRRLSDGPHCELPVHSLGDVRRCQGRLRAGQGGEEEKFERDNPGTL